MVTGNSLTLFRVVRLAGYFNKSSLNVSMSDREATATNSGILPFSSCVDKAVSFALMRALKVETGAFRAMAKWIGVDPSCVDDFKQARGSRSATNRTMEGFVSTKVHSKWRGVIPSLSCFLQDCE